MPQSDLSRFSSLDRLPSSHCLIRPLSCSLARQSHNRRTSEIPEHVRVHLIQQVCLQVKLNALLCFCVIALGGSALFGVSPQNRGGRKEDYSKRMDELLVGLRDMVFSWSCYMTGS